MTFRMRWALYAVLATIPVVAGLVGGTMASSKPVVYTAEARLAMGRADLIDATAQAQAANFARYLSPQTVMKQLPPGAVLDVSASPIPETNVIRVEAKAVDSANAVLAARVAAKGLQAQVTSLAGQTKTQETLRQVQRLNRQVANYQSRVNASGGSGSDYVEAATALASAQVQQQALSAIYADRARTAANSTLTLLAPPAATGDDAASRKQIYMLAGFGGGALVAYVIARIVGDLRRDGRGHKQAKEPVRATAGAEPNDLTDLADHPDEGSRLIREYVPDARAEQPASSPALSLRQHARQAAAPTPRRGLNGLRQEPSTSRRTWP